MGEVEGTAVSARWSEAGLWQTFSIENHGGRAIYSGDAIFIKAHTGKLLHVQDTAVLAEWSDYGAWQTFILHRKDGEGPVMPGDRIFLSAHTGRLLEVEGDAVNARWYDTGAWQTFTVEIAAPRRLTEFSQDDLVDSRGNEHSNLFFV